MSDTPFDFKKLMEQAQNMQKQWQNVQEELSKVTVTGEAGAGLVKITMTNQAITEVKIDDEIFNEKDKTVLEDLIAAAMNDALRKRESASQESLVKKMNDNLNLKI
jgi:DNA-binding YbaB/EbfC family protein